MKDINRRKLHELYLINNLQRLSDETLAYIIEKIEDEVERSIDEELKQD